ncbi:hypothetical protein Jab_2c19480 [Janthinobacterium sp. HH01]|nr:hypothetical protein Jab_2c19480 [Janthinobacterium sp. HH01]
MNNVTHAPWPVKRKAEPDILRENALREGKKIRLMSFPRRRESILTMDSRFRGNDYTTYFLAGAGAEPAAPELLKYLKKSELESITITSP